MPLLLHNPQTDLMPDSSDILAVIVTVSPRVTSVLSIEIDSTTGGLLSLLISWTVK